MISQVSPLLLMPMLVFTSILVTMVCRFYASACRAACSYHGGGHRGVFAVGGIAGAAGGGPAQHGLPAGLPDRVFLQLLTLRLQAPSRRRPCRRPASISCVRLGRDRRVRRHFAGLAQLLRLENAYWVPVSCLAVIQGVSLRAVWNKQFQRILGTGIGLLLSWGLFLLPLDAWGLALIMMALTFVVEMTVVRHYAFATVFITPLTILLAEAATLGHTPPTVLIQARFFDTVLGSLVGLAGGICLHSPRFRDVVGRRMRRLLPSRIARP